MTTVDVDAIPAQYSDHVAWITEQARSILHELPYVEDAFARVKAFVRYDELYVVREMVVILTDTRMMHLPIDDLYTNDEWSRNKRMIEAGILYTHFKPEYIKSAIEYSYKGMRGE